MTPDDQPLLNVPSLVALILHEAAARRVDADSLVDRLDGLLAQAHEHREVPRETLRAELQALCDDLTIARLLAAEDGGHALTERGREALDTHPEGMDRADLARYPEYAEHVRRQAALTARREDAHHAAYLQGVAARVAGRSLTDNPHPPEAGDHGAWEDGWSEA
jgi:hypothetical protein